MTILVAAVFYGCNLDSSPVLENQDAPVESVTLGINLGGKEWRASQTATVGGRVDGHLYYGYKVYIREEEGEERPYAAGITTSIDRVTIDYEANREYRMEISSMRFSSEHDIANLIAIFNHREDSSEEFENYMLYYPQVVTGIGLEPFNTYVTFETTDPYFPSDKFIGEAIFSVNGEEDEVEVDMFRFSAGIGFRVLNLASGVIQITFNLHQHSFSYNLDREQHEVTEIRPLYSIYSHHNLFEGNELNIPDAFRQEYSITVRLLEDGADGEERILLNTEVHLRRNYMTTYELDMEPFYQEPDKTGGSIRLDFVDDELTDRGTVNF